MSCQVCFCFIIVLILGRALGFIHNAMNFGRSGKTSVRSTPTQFRCKKNSDQSLSTVCLKVPPGVTVTLTIEKQAQISQEPEPSNHGQESDGVSSKLLDRIIQSERLCRTLEYEVYQRNKLEIVAELARIYKERIVDYQLKHGETHLTWEHLIVIGDKEEVGTSSVQLAQEEFPDLKAELVTDVHHFIQNHPTPSVVRSVESTSFAKIACENAREFKFRDGDFHQDLAGKLCEVIEHYLEQRQLPVGIRFFVGPDAREEWEDVSDPNWDSFA